jgi:putative flippase GtrA
MLPPCGSQGATKRIGWSGDCGAFVLSATFCQSFSRFYSVKPLSLSRLEPGRLALAKGRPAPPGWRTAANVICETAMTRLSRDLGGRPPLLAGWRYRALSRKAFSFALIGVVNSLVDYGVFLFARAQLAHSPAALAVIRGFAEICHCGTPAVLLLIAPNLISWLVAVSGSYILNSSITFAAESQRQLRWRAYFTFILAGIAGLLANTATLLVAAEVLLLPVWLAKAIAILASFVVNFSLSHFVVFRVRAQHRADKTLGDA